MNDSERLQLRAKLKRDLAESLHHRRVTDELAAQIQAHQAKIDELAANHERECQPLRDKLTEIENRQIEQILQQQKADPKLDAKRKGLQAEILEKTASFERTLEEERVSIELVERAHAIAEKKAGQRSVIESELIRHANPERRESMAIASKLASDAVNRVQAIESDRPKMNPKFYERVIEDSRAAARKYSEERDRVTREAIDSDD